MKKILFIIGILFCFVGTASAQHVGKIKIDADQNEDIQYVPVSFNGRLPLSMTKQKAGRNDTKGHYSGVPLTEVTDAIAVYLAANNLLGPSEATVNQLISDSIATFISEAEINQLISDSIATVGGGGGGGSTYEDICECKYLHMIVRFNLTGAPTVEWWKSNIDFDLFDFNPFPAGQGTPVFTRQGVGNYRIAGSGVPDGNIIGSAEQSYFSVVYRGEINVLQTTIGTWSTSIPEFEVWDSSVATYDLPSNVTASIRIEFPLP